MGAVQKHPEPVERFLERLRALKKRTGKTLAELQKAGIASRSAMSRYLNGIILMPKDVLVAMCKLAESPPQELEELERLRVAALDARSDSRSASVQPDPDGNQPDQSALNRELTTRRRWPRITYASATALVVGILLVATITRADSGNTRQGEGVPNPTPGESQPGCLKAQQYKATINGNVVDDTMSDIGDIVRGELFTAIESPAHPHTRTRYYGTIPDKNMAGYVLKTKLTYYRDVCI